MTSSLTKFDTGHEDLIHDVAYDFYGKRLVTCSSDQKLKVWDFVEREDCSVWELSDSWKAHDSSILKAIWARPEYGQVIASCSFDRQVKIWEEQPTGKMLMQPMGVNHTHARAINVYVSTDTIFFFSK